MHSLVSWVRVVVVKDMAAVLLAFTGHDKQKALESPKGITCLSTVVSVKRKDVGGVCLRLACKRKVTHRQ